MIFLIGMIGLASVLPLWFDYNKNPADNLFVRSRSDALRDAQRVIIELTLASASAHSGVLAEIPAWMRNLIVWVLQLIVRLLGSVARA